MSQAQLWKKGHEIGTSSLYLSNTVFKLNFVDSVERIFLYLLACHRSKDKLSGCPWSQCLKVVVSPALKECYAHTTKYSMFLICFPLLIVSACRQKKAKLLLFFQVRGSSASPPIYEVHLEDAESAEALRKASSVYTRKKNPVRCPPELKGIEVFNSVTLATRVRISILRVCLHFCIQ